MSSLSLALSQSFLNTFQVQIYKFSDTVTWDSSIISFTWWNFWSFLINTPALASLHSPWWATLFQEEQTIFLFIENRLHCYNVLYIMAMGQRIQSNGFTKHLNNQWNSRTIQIGQCEHIVKFITFKTQLMYRFIHWFLSVLIWHRHLPSQNAMPCFCLSITLSVYSTHLFPPEGPLSVTVGDVDVLNWMNDCELNTLEDCVKQFATRTL